MAPGSLWLQEEPHCDAILWFASSALKSWNVSDKGHFRWMETAWGVHFPPFTDFRGTDPNVWVVSLARLDEAPKAAFSSVLFRQPSSIDLMRIDRVCGIFIRRKRIEFCKIPSRMAIGGRSSAIEDVVEKGAE